MHTVVSPENAPGESKQYSGNSADEVTEYAVGAHDRPEANSR